MVLNFDTEIEILLHDQNKIVTYKELSNKFNLTPYEARKKLENFVTNKREKENEKSNFYVTYLISGEEKSTKTNKIQLVNENDFDKFNKETKVFSKQIYSIQNNIIEDFNLIYTSDLDASSNIERKSNINVISGQNDRKEIRIQEDVKPNVKAPKVVAQPQSNINSNTTSNVPKSNILVDSLKTNIKKEEILQEKEVAKKDDSNQISETVTKKLKIDEEKKDEEATKSVFKAAPKKNEPAKKANNQSITNFFKKA